MHSRMWAWTRSELQWRMGRTWMSKPFQVRKARSIRLSCL